MWFNTTESHLLDPDSHKGRGGGVTKSTRLQQKAGLNPDFVNKEGREVMSENPRLS